MVVAGIDRRQAHFEGLHVVCKVQAAGSTHRLWKVLIAADQTKWTPAPCQAPVCLKQSEQSERAANKWIHSLRLGAVSPAPSLLSLLCSLWVI